jgi:peptidyl-prolyl cis-trans isomerase D
MFNMAQGTAKRIEGPARQGWFIVKLDQIVPGEVTAGGPEVASVRRELGRLMGEEYADQFRRALRREVKVERNTNAIQAVEKQLTGGGQ